MKNFSKRSSTLTQEMHFKCIPLACFWNEKNEKSIIIFEKMFKHTDRQIDCCNPPPTLGLIMNSYQIAIITCI